MDHGHDGGRGVWRVDTGPPRTSLVGSESEGPGECHDSEMVSSERC